MFFWIPLLVHSFILQSLIEIYYMSHMVLILNIDKKTPCLFRSVKRKIVTIVS